MLALNHLEGADAAAYVDADFLPIFGCHVEAGLGHGEIRGRQGELDEPAHLLDFFALDEVFGDEVLDFAGDPAAKSGGVEKGDRADAGFSLQESLPSYVRSHTQGAYQTDSGHHYATLLNVHSL